MIGRPGSTLWLACHEIRLQIRGSLLGRAGGRWLVLAIAAGIQALGLLFASSLLRLQQHVPISDPLMSVSVVMALTGALMMAQAVQRATEVLDGQADLGWLLSSPLPPRRVLAVRLVSVAFSVVLNWLLLVGPIANGLMMLGHVGAWRAYPVVASIALVATAVGFGLTFSLLRALGPRRTRSVANGAATIIGASAFLVGQSRTILSTHARDALWTALMPAHDAAPQGIGWWPARALIEGGWRVAGVVVIGAAATVLASIGLQQWFARGALGGVSADRGGPGEGSRAGRLKLRPFQGGLRQALLRRDLLLLRRFPGLAGLSIYYMIYLLPAVVVLWRGGGDQSDRALAAAPVLTAGELARLFVSACVLGDDGRELVDTAPVSEGTVLRSKLAAAGIGVATVMYVPVLGLAMVLPSALPAMVVGLTGVVLCNLLLGLWRPAPIRRTDLRRGQKGWGGLVNVVGLFFSGAWSTATWFALRSSPWAALPAGAAVLLLLMVRPTGGGSRIVANG
jgi:ABC-2 type transport system permease protein